MLFIETILGTYKVRNETKSTKTKRNERNEINETKGNEINEMKKKWNEANERGHMTVENWWHYVYIGMCCFLSIVLKRTENTDILILVVKTFCFM